MIFGFLALILDFLHRCTLILNNISIDFSMIRRYRRAWVIPLRLFEHSFDCLNDWVCLKYTWYSKIIFASLLVLHIVMFWTLLVISTATSELHPKNEASESSGNKIQWNTEPRTFLNSGKQSFGNLKYHDTLFEIF